MTDHSPDIEHAITQATHELARRLAPWVTGMQDPTAFARGFIEDLHKHGWRPIPRPAQITTNTQPGDYHRGAAAARQALQALHTDEEPS